MWKKYISLCVSVFFTCLNVCAQSSWMEWEEQIGEEANLSSWEELYENLSELAEHPFNINTVTKEELEQLPFLSDKMVENARSFEKVLPEFLAFAGDDVLAGHNIAGFDMKFLYRDCEKYFGQTLTNDYIDTLAIAKLCFPEWKHRRLSDLAEHYGISTKGAHRTLADCRMNQQVFELMAKESGGTSAKQTEEKICPRCGLALKKRNGRFGGFWGCTGFPDCRYTENV